MALFIGFKLEGFGPLPQETVSLPSGLGQVSEGCGVSCCSLRVMFLFAKFQGVEKSLHASFPPISSARQVRKLTAADIGTQI